MIFKNLSLSKMRPIYRVHATHTIRGVALSMVSIYIPAYLMTQGYSLVSIIFFYALLHITGLAITLFVTTRLVNRFGTLHTLRWCYPFHIAYFVLLLLLGSQDIPLWVIAVAGGIAEFLYWVPLNMILLRNAGEASLGKDLSMFFALPKFFSIFGPIASALLIPIIGFWWVFLVSSLGLIASFLPLAGLSEEPRGNIIVWSRIKDLLQKRKKLFFLEGLDNVLEEAEWFWGIYVFLLFGSLSIPGIVGSLEAVGGALFALFVGSKISRSQNRFIFFGAALLFLVSFLRMFFSENFFTAYAFTVTASFALVMFLVSYTSLIYQKVKKDDEEEFIILREIPAVFARLVVYFCILATMYFQELFFLIPMLVVPVLLFGVRKLREEQSKNVPV